MTVLAQRRSQALDMIAFQSIWLKILETLVRNVCETASFRVLANTRCQLEHRCVRPDFALPIVPLRHHLRTRRHRRSCCLLLGATVVCEPPFARGLIS
jgi:hypothetical protein